MLKYIYTIRNHLKKNIACTDKHILHKVSNYNEITISNSNLSLL